MIRRFGYLEVLNTDELKHFLLSKIGVDPFSKTLSIDYLRNVFKNKYKNIKMLT